MNQKSSIAMLMAVLLAGQSTAMAAPAPVELKWSELSFHIQGRNIELVLPEGTSVGGQVEAVREDALVLTIRKTSNAKTYPKGNAVIPRDAVNTLSVKEFRGKWGRSVGVSLGIITGITYGGYAAIAGTNSAAAGLPTFLAITGAATIAGYYLGKSADRRAKRIRVIP